MRDVKRNNVNERIPCGTVCHVNTNKLTNRNGYIICFEDDTAGYTHGHFALYEGEALMVVASYEVITELTTVYNVTYMVVTAHGVGYYIDEDIFPGLQIEPVQASVDWSYTVEKEPQ